MSITRAFAAIAATLAAALTLTAAPAHADGVPAQPFYADSLSSFDNCPHGTTSGTLTWLTPGPLAAIAVDVNGIVVDRPTISGALNCSVDDFSSTAIITAYSGKVVLDQQAVTADNSTKGFTFALGGDSTATRLTHVVIQVCRDPIHTLPPSYCGRAVTYQP